MEGTDALFFTKGMGVSNTFADGQRSCLSIVGASGGHVVPAEQASIATGAVDAPMMSFPCRVTLRCGRHNWRVQTQVRRCGRGFHFPGHWGSCWSAVQVTTTVVGVG